MTSNCVFGFPSERIMSLMSERYKLAHLEISGYASENRTSVHHMILAADGSDSVFNTLLVRGECTEKNMHFVILISGDPFCCLPR